MESFEPLSKLIIGEAFRAHNLLGPGHLEIVYRNALALLLRKRGLILVVEARLIVEFQGLQIGHCEADLIVSDLIVVETKVNAAVLPGHESRLGAYLRCSKYEVGLVLNFGPRKVDVKRVIESREERMTG